MADPPRRAALRGARSRASRSSRPGIKVIDLLAPVREGRQGRPLRRRRRRQDRPDPGAHPQHRGGARGPLRLRGCGRANARGERPLARDDGVGRDREDGARLRADERAPGRAPPRRPLRARPWPSTSASRARTPCSSSTTSSASCRRDPRSPRSSAACRPRWDTSRRSRPRWASSRSGSPRRATGSVTSVQAIYVPADDLTDPAPAASSRTSTRPPCSRGRSPSRRSTRPSIRSTRSRAPPAGHRGRGALPDGDGRAGDPPALQGAPGHHRHPRDGGALGRGQAHRPARAQDPAVPLAAVLRRRGLHREPGQVRASRRHDPRLRRDHRRQARRASRGGLLHGRDDRGGRGASPGDGRGGAQGGAGGRGGAGRAGRGRDRAAEPATV